MKMTLHQNTKCDSDLQHKRIMTINIYRIAYHSLTHTHTLIARYQQYNNY